LNGYEWELPGNLGTLCIFKNSLKIGQFPKIAKKESIEHKQIILLHNPKKIGLYYSIELNSPILEANGMEFKPCQKLRKLLFQAVFNQNREYRSR
jgi:hypothetical protein